MKNYNKNTISIYSIFFISFSFSFFIFSCQSVEEESDGAYEEAKVSKEFSDDSLEMETEPELAPLLATKPMKVVVIDSWTKYSNEIEKEIKSNESLIAELRSSSSSNVKTFKKITTLESANQDLHKRMIDYDIEAKADLEKFKSELKADMLVLKTDLSELSISIETK